KHHPRFALHVSLCPFSLLRTDFIRFLATDYTDYGWGGRRRLSPPCSAGWGQTPPSLPLNLLGPGLEMCVPFVETAWPVFLQEPGQGAVREEFALRLTCYAVVALIFSINDALDGTAAHRAGLAITAVDGHIRPERGHFCGKLSVRFSL